MRLNGKWHIIARSDFDAGDPDMVESANLV